MPAYDFKCERCGYIEEVVCKMEEVSSYTVFCMECHEAGDKECGIEMYRLFSNGGVILKGEGWPSKDIRRQNEDHNLTKARRTAVRLKNSGVVPQGEQIKQETAGPLMDKLGSAVHKKEIERLEDGTVDAALDKAISEE